MSDHYSIYCESLSCVLFNLTNDFINKQLTDEDFLQIITSYKSVSEVYLTSLKLKSLHMCCKGHLSIHKEEISHVEYLISILSSDTEIVKSTLINMHAMGKMDISKNDEETIH